MIGKQLGQYEIVEELGHGGMGTVYRARQLSLNRDVALKILPSHLALDPTGLERFRREAMSVAQLAHPNIVQVYDIGEDNGVHFIAMEYVRGRTAAELLKADGPLAFRKAIEICAPIAATLGVAHKAGIVHRDVKPSNILVSEAGFAKLADFGVAGLMQPPEGERLTMTGAAVGTPYYMSPEQVRGRDALDGASDVYSLGVVLYELLSGVHPFGDATPTEAIAKQMHEPFPPIRRYWQDIPDELEQVLGRCLEKNRAERFQNGEELCQALEMVRLRLGFEESESGEDYRKRISGTGFFYVDDAQKRKAKAAVGLRALCREMVAQARDPNKRSRKALQVSYTHSVLARDEYKRAEQQLDEFRKRLKHHQDKAAQHRTETQKLIAADRTEEAAASAEKEANCDRLALDYAQQAEELGKQVQELRERYDGLREEHAESADELALRDAEARRKGKAIPGGSANPDLAHRARILRFALLIILLCLLVAGTGWLGVYLLSSEPPPRVHAPAPVPVERVPVAPSPKRTPQDGLVLYYPFDKDEGGTVTDQSGQGNNGTVNGATWVPSGISGGAYSFDGVNDDIYLGTPNLLPKGVGTVSVWTKLASSTKKNNYLITFGSDSRWGGSWGLDIAPQDSAHASLVLLYISGGSQWVYDTIPAPYSVSDWHMFSAVMSKEGTQHLYLDGVLVFSGSHPVATPDPTYKLYVGRDDPDNISSGFLHNPYSVAGFIDEVRVYNRALSAQEIHQLFTSASQRAVAASMPVAQVRLPDDGLMLHYTFNKDEGGKVSDQSGMGNDAIVHGATWNGNGKIGGAFEFNGLNAYLQSVRPIAITGKAPRTVSAWVRLDRISRNGISPYVSWGWDGNGMDMPADPHGQPTEGLYSLAGWGYNGGNRFAMWGIGSNSQMPSTATVAAGQWHHTAAVFDGANAWLYLDGQLDTSGPVQLETLSTECHIGKRLGYHPDREWFMGVLDDVRIYNRALSADEILSLCRVAEGRAAAAGVEPITFGGVDWLPWRTAFEVQGDKLVSLPKARPGFNYGHVGSGRGAWLVSNVGNPDWKDYSIEVEFGMRGMDPAFNPYGLPPDCRGGSIMFHLADLKESWNERGWSTYRLAVGSDGSWGLACMYNMYCHVPSGNGDMRGDGERMLAQGKGLTIDPANGNKVRIEVRGPRIRVWIDGVPLADVQDEKMRDTIGGTTLDHGGVGFEWIHDSMGWIRNFSVTRY